MSDDEEVGHDDGDEHDKDLHQGNEESSYHVEFREGVFGSGSDVSDGAIGSAEGMPVHNSSHIAVLGQTLAHEFMAVAE